MLDTTDTLTEDEMKGLNHIVFFKGHRALLVDRKRIYALVSGVWVRYLGYGEFYAELDRRGSENGTWWKPAPWVDYDAA
jgi:hypothetical protein